MANEAIPKTILIVGRDDPYRPNPHRGNERDPAAKARSRTKANCQPDPEHSPPLRPEGPQVELAANKMAAGSRSPSLLRGRGSLRPGYTHAIQSGTGTFSDAQKNHSATFASPGASGHTSVDADALASTREARGTTTPARALRRDTRRRRPAPAQSAKSSQGGTKSAGRAT